MMVCRGGGRPLAGRQRPQVRSRGRDIRDATVSTGVVLRLAAESLLRYYDAAPALHPACCRVRLAKLSSHEDFVARALPAGGLARFNGIVTISRDRIFPAGRSRSAGRRPPGVPLSDVTTEPIR
jgi:hypothetical protein